MRNVRGASVIACVAIVLLAAFRSGGAAEPARSSSAGDREWDAVMRANVWTAPRAIEGVSTVQDAISRWGDGSAGYHAWLERYRRQIWVEGKKLWHAYPANPKRYNWFTWTSQLRPEFWVDIEQGASAHASRAPERAVVDEGAVKTWEGHYALMRAEFFRPQAANDAQRELLRYEELRRRMERGMKAVPQEGARRNPHTLSLLIDLWDFSESLPADSETIPEVTGLVERLLNYMELDPAREAVGMQMFKTSRQSDLREFAQGREQLVRLRKTPMQERFNTMDGGVIDLVDWRGKVVLLDFWFTGCPSCLEAMPGIKRSYDRYHSKGFEVLGICFEREAERQKVTRVLKRMGIPWPQSLQGQSASERLPLLEKYGIVGMPAYFLLDRNGRLVTNDVGLGHGNRLEKELERLLGP